MTVSCAHKRNNDPAGAAASSSAPASNLLIRDVLPTNVRPTHYDLTITPDMESFVFDGRVDIKLQVVEDGDEVKLNAKELAIKSAKVVLPDSNEVINAACTFDPAREEITLKLDKALSRDSTALLSIEYSGIINDKMAGFYRSSYKSKDGKAMYMGATQFESTDARQALPCWDEPAIKATFDVTLIIPTGLTGLSNMDLLEETTADDRGKSRLRFRTTPIMSTYLLAWVIGDLESIETKNKHGVTVRVFTTKGDIEQARFALDVGSRTLDFFTEYFDMEYPLPKMDMVAIPDFSAGAMENWGLVTYRTTYLLFDEARSSLKSKQNVAYVVGHELAHQWFGNLVTMEWWSDLWLNEGFATWVGWLAADHLFPEWDIWTQFVVDDCNAGLSLDGLRSSHPIEVPVKNPAEISQIFDSISYSKGAAVIRMLVTYLGEETFRRGLQQYLKKHQYKNARTEDLWNSLSQASGQSVNQIMDSWTRKIGYPVLEVSVAEGSESGLQLEVTQSRFLSMGGVKPEEDTTLWNVPLRLATDRDAASAKAVDNALLSRKKDTIQLPGDIAYFKLNMGQTGFYRVNYPSDWLAKLGAAIKNGQLPAADRLGLVADAFALSTAGRLGLTEVLALLRNFENETEYLVWNEISLRLAEMLSTWWEQPEEEIASLKAFIADLYAGPVQRLGFDFAPEESDMIKLLRPLAIGMAGKCGHKHVIAEAKSRFADFVGGDQQRIHPNLRGTIYSIVVREGGAQEFQEVLKLYEAFTVPDQKLAALGALGSSRDPAVIASVLELTKKGDIVRPQDVIYITRTTGANPAARRPTWKFVQENWDFFYNRYGIGGGISLLGRIVSTATQDFTDEKDAKSVESFFAGKETTTFDLTLKQSLERIRMNAGWLTANRQAVAQWLRGNMRRVF